MTKDMSNAPDAECTDCGGSGVTYQTERRCSCKAGAIADAPDGTPKSTRAVGMIGHIDNAKTNLAAAIALILRPGQWLAPI